MSNGNFWLTISAIIDGDFDEEGLSQLEQYAEQFINQQLLFKRYTPAEQLGCSAGGSLHVAASILAGAETAADKHAAPQGSFKRLQQRAEAQATAVEKWAQAAGCWLDDTDKAFPSTFGEQIAEGGEAHVYDNGNMIVKRIGLDY